jgi:hypothetical protein
MNTQYLVYLVWDLAATLWEAPYNYYSWTP